MSGCLKRFLIFHMSLTTPPLNYSLQALHHLAAKFMLVATIEIMCCIYQIMLLLSSKGILTVEQARCPLSVSSVASVLSIQDTLGNMKESTLGKSPMNVNSVESVLAYQES